jgi:salicylate hydroxylase
MTDYKQDADGVTITFGDGTSAQASALIACDGIKSLCRKIVLGHESPEAEPVYAGEYAYRTLLDRSVANKILTSELAGNGNIYCGRGGYIITYPVDKGKLVNVVAIKRKDAWEEEEWLAPCPRENMLAEFDDWGVPLQRLVSEISDTKQWALFDAPDASTFYSGRVCLVGDAAHASTPNQGAGAGMAFEDAYVLSTLLGRAAAVESVGDVFEAFDAVRRPRTQRLVATSRSAGEVYEFAHDAVGTDLVKVKENLDRRHAWIWEEDLPGEVEGAIEFLRRCKAPNVLASTILYSQ